MQLPFTYSPKELESVRFFVSEERLESYLVLAHGDLRKAIHLYERNCYLSEALYGLLQGLEVPLRNAMHRVLSHGFGQDNWYDIVLWRLAQQEQIDSAKASLRKKAKPITSGRMVAELTFGFWVGLTGPKYSVNIWEQHLFKAFPNKKLGRKDLNKRLESIRLLRNRIAHHEPILSRDLPGDVERILETVGWINHDVERWIRQINCFSERYIRPTFSPP